MADIIDYNAACGAVIAPAAGYVPKKPRRVQGFCHTGTRMIIRNARSASLIRI